MPNEYQGLAALRKYQQEQKEKQEAANRPKADWFKWPGKVSQAEVLFLQELDPAATGYREDRGIGFIQVEHQAPGPDGYKRRANCTIESEGECYACERHSQDYKEGWRQRTNLYINALVRFEGEDKPKPVIISRNANSSFVAALIEEAVEENTITAVNYKITKVGEGTTTQWLLRASKNRFDDSEVEVFPLKETAIREVAYDKQPDYYGAVYSGPAETAAAATPARSTSVDEVW